MDDASEPFDVERAVSALISSPDEREREAILKREMGLYIASPDEKRRVVEERLRAIHGLPEPRLRTRKDVIGIGEMLGMQQANVYRLLKRIDTHGPVTGLLPGHRAKSRSGAASDGFGEPVDGLIAEAMRHRPDVTIAEISKTLRSKAALWAEREPPESFAVPGASMLRRRVHALRAAGTTGMGDLPSVGGSILIDQCHLDLMIRFRMDGGERVETRYASMTVILDAPSSLILGIGIFVEKDSAGGLLAALRDLPDRMRRMADAGLVLEKAPSTIRWMVPDALRPAAGRVERIVAELDPPVHLVALTEKDSYPGVELYRHLGENLGPFHLQPRPSAFGRRDWGGLGTPVGSTVFGLATAESSFAYEADERNGRRLEGMTSPGREPTDPAHAELFAAALNRVFEPVAHACAEDVHWSRRRAD